MAQTPGDPDYSSLTVDPNMMFDREPHAVFLKTEDGRLDFALVIVHVTWGDTVGPPICDVPALKSYYEDVFSGETVSVGAFKSDEATGVPFRADRYA